MRIRGGVPLLPRFGHVTPLTSPGKMARGRSDGARPTAPPIAQSSVRRGNVPRVDDKLQTDQRVPSVQRHQIDILVDPALPVGTWGICGAAFYTAVPEGQWCCGDAKRAATHDPRRATLPVDNVEVVDRDARACPDATRDGGDVIRGFPDVFVTRDPSGDVCLFTRLDPHRYGFNAEAVRRPDFAYFERLELKRNRVCCMHTAEMAMLEWIDPVDVLTWVLGEPPAAAAVPDEPCATTVGVAHA